MKYIWVPLSTQVKFSTSMNALQSSSHQIPFFYHINRNSTVRRQIWPQLETVNFFQKSPTQPYIYSIRIPIPWPKYSNFTFIHIPLQFFFFHVLCETHSLVCFWIHQQYEASSNTSSFVSNLSPIGPTNFNPLPTSWYVAHSPPHPYRYIKQPSWHRNNCVATLHQMEITQSHLNTCFTIYNSTQQKLSRTVSDFPVIPGTGCSTCAP